MSAYIINSCFSEGGFLDRGIEEPHAAFSPILPGRALTYADEETTDSERIGVFEVTTYSEQQVTVTLTSTVTVSYTHLDVYKRQHHIIAGP